MANPLPDSAGVSLLGTKATPVSTTVGVRAESPKKGQFAAWLAFITVCVVWGSTYLAIRIAVATCPPFLFAGVRFLVAGLGLLGICWGSGQAIPRRPTDLWHSALTGILLLVGCNGLVMVAEQRVQSGMAALLLAATPLYTAMLEHFLFPKQRLGRSGWLLMVTGFAGVAWLIVSGQGLQILDWGGSALLLVAGVFWALGSIQAKSSRPAGSSLARAGVQMVVAGVILLGGSWLSGERVPAQIPASALWALGYLIVFGSMVGYGANMYLLSRWSAARATSSTYVNPVVAVILGVLILGEPLGLAMILAMGTTLASVILLHGARREPPRESQVPPAVAAYPSERLS